MGPTQRCAPCEMAVDRGGNPPAKLREMRQGRDGARLHAGVGAAAGARRGTNGHDGGRCVAHRRPDIALQHDAFNALPGRRVPFYLVRKQGLVLDVSLVSSVSSNVGFLS